MPLVLQIDTDENYDFFVLYDNLSPLRKKIWDKISHLSRSWTCVIPSQSKIALWCECSRSAVSEAFRLFQDYGWMCLQSRGWKRSKKIFISTSKQQIDVNNRNYFKEVKATYRATHTVFTYGNNTSRKTPGLLAIPHYLRDKKEIPLEIKLKLSLVSEKSYQEAFFQCSKRAQKGFKPDNYLKYFTGTCLAIAINRGEILKWDSYYHTVRHIKKFAA